MHLSSRALPIYLVVFQLFIPAVCTSSQPLSQQVHVFLPLGKSFMRSPSHNDTEGHRISLKRILAQTESQHLVTSKENYVYKQHRAFSVSVANNAFP